MKISKRLETIAQMVTAQSTVADIGTDHGYLPCYLIQHHLAVKVIAADMNPLPLQVAQRTIAEQGLSEKIETRLGNGLSVLSPDEVDTVTISGMGGGLIAEILSSEPTVCRSLKRLILQPNVAAYRLRHWAYDHGWQIIAEELLKEDNHYYEIIVLEQGQTVPLNVAEFFIGPLLLQKRHPLLIEYLQKEKKRDDAILTKLAADDSADALYKKTQLLNKWQTINEVITCQFSVNKL